MEHFRTELVGTGQMAFGKHTVFIRDVVVTASDAPMCAVEITAHETAYVSAVLNQSKTITGAVEAGEGPTCVLEIPAHQTASFSAVIHEPNLLSTDDPDGQEAIQ